MNFMGMLIPQHVRQCHYCGRKVGPQEPIKTGYLVQGMGGGFYCNRTHAIEAREKMEKAQAGLSPAES